MTYEDMPAQSCPLGFTDDDLEGLLGEHLPAFHKWMTGQTGAICEGKEYVHERRHDEYCGHADGEAFTWKCGYTGVGEYRPDACSGSPHGFVTYRTDVGRFLLGLPVTD